MVVASQPTVFHITHWKAGSQWVAEILKHSAPDRFLPWQMVGNSPLYGPGMATFHTQPLIPGKIYGTVYLPKHVFNEITTGAFWRTPLSIFAYPKRVFSNYRNYRIFKKTAIRFFVLRDLRDTLISLYYSTRYSHKIVADFLDEQRNTVSQETEEDGLIYLIKNVLPVTAAIQGSWVGDPSVKHLRYEDIIGNEFSFFEELIDYCQIQIERERLREIVRYNIFEAATGRKPGQEDPMAHLRKGIAGDWKNHFTDRVKNEFKAHYGELLVRTGYEKDLSW